MRDGEAATFLGIELLDGFGFGAIFATAGFEKELFGLRGGGGGTLLVDLGGGRDGPFRT